MSEVDVGAADQAERITIAHAPRAAGHERAGEPTRVGDDPGVAAVIVRGEVRGRRGGLTRHHDVPDCEEVEQRARPVDGHVDRSAGQQPALAPWVGELLDPAGREPVVPGDLA